MTQSPFPEPSRGASTAFRAALNGWNGASDGVTGHPERIANHLAGEALPLVVAFPFVFPLPGMAALLLTILAVVLVMSATGDDERNEQG